MPQKKDPSQGDLQKNTPEEESQTGDSIENTELPENADIYGDSVSELSLQDRLLQYPFINGIYRYLYFLGLQVMRYIRRRTHKISYKWNQFCAHMRMDLQHIWKSIRIASRSNWSNLTAPVRELRLCMRDLLDDLNYEKKYGSKGSRMKSRSRLAWFLICRLFSVLRWLFNYIAPVVACIFILWLAGSYASQTYVLRLEYNGEEIGYISDESIFTQAQNAMKGRLRNVGGTSPVINQPRYELIQRNGEQLLTVDRLTDILIRSSGNELKEADGLYVETAVGSSQMELVGAVENGTELLEYLETIREQYRTSSMGSNTRIEFLKKIQLKRGLYPVGSVKPVGEVKASLMEEERGESYYTVVTGDTPLRIAAKNGVSTAELQTMNPSVDIEKSLFPGDELLVSRSMAKLGVKVTTTSRYQEKIPYTISQETDSSEPIGSTKTKQEGKEGVREYTAEIVYIDGSEVERKIVDQRVVREPVEEILLVGGSRPLQVVPKDSSQKVPSGAFAWPASGGSITTGYMGYYGHTGSDITFSGCYGTPVYAAAPGVVTRVQYGSTGYGYHIIVDHGNGYTTLYAHCSELFVTVGQQVSQGQQIARIGRTGMATGPHLHFEVRTGGVAVNAAPYLYN